MAGLQKKEGITNRTVPFNTEIYEQAKAIAKERGIGFNALMNFALRSIIASERKNAKIQY